MEETRRQLSLTTIAEGAAIEMFDEAMQKIIENVQDPNTTLKPRTIQLTVKVTPSKNRHFIETDIAIANKLAGQVSVQATAVIERDQSGKPRAFCHDAQLDLPFNVNSMNIQGEA
jgi:hypothetical protein